MGYKYEVHAWDGETLAALRYTQVYAGGWLVIAVFAAWKLRRSGCKCIKLEIRDY